MSTKAFLTFHRPVAFKPIAELSNFTQSQETQTLLLDLQSVGLAHISCYAARTETGLTTAALTIACAPGPKGSEQQIAQSIARAEAALERPTAVLGVPAGTVALSVTEATHSEGFPWPVARYRAWLPLPRYESTIVMDLSTPHVPGWEMYGPVMATVVRSVRIQEGDDQ